MKLHLGLDSSNYTSSVALTDEGNRIICDSRRLLKVKEGEKGLRQSDALFQHWNNLPEMLEPVLKEYGKDIVSVCASSRPRPQEGSYMPVFLAGCALGRTIAAALGVPFTETSHQEGHLKAASLGHDIDFSKPLLCAHLSGGTLELTEVKDNKINVAAATKDISYGQLLDRTGVMLGFPFPAGRYIDELAMSYTPESRQNPFSAVKTGPEGLNLSGLETQLKKAAESLSKEELSYWLMKRISESFIKLSKQVLKEKGIEQYLIFGGVASSAFLRKSCEEEGCGWVFGDPQLCSDNACGVSCLSGGLFE